MSVVLHRPDHVPGMRLGLDTRRYLNWPADKLVFGMPLYSNSPIVPWFVTRVVVAAVPRLVTRGRCCACSCRYQAMEQNFKAGSADAALLMTP